MLFKEGFDGVDLVFYVDNGSLMKGVIIKAMMECLGIIVSFSCLRVSDDNSYSEVLFCMFKYSL